MSGVLEKMYLSGTVEQSVLLRKYETIVVQSV